MRSSSISNFWKHKNKDWLYIKLRSKHRLQMDCHYAVIQSHQTLQSHGEYFNVCDLLSFVLMQRELSIRTTEFLAPLLFMYWRDK